MRLLSAFLVACLACASQPATAGGDPAKGERLYARCMGCHAIDRNRVGPRHAGLIGRVAGSLPDFDYSKAMRESGLVWDEATLDRFLADPRGVVPGTKMGFAGVKDPGERADLIAFLRTTSPP